MPTPTFLQWASRVCPRGQSILLCPVAFLLWTSCYAVTWGDLLPTGAQCFLHLVLISYFMQSPLSLLFSITFSVYFDRVRGKNMHSGLSCGFPRSFHTVKHFKAHQSMRIFEVKTTYQFLSGSAGRSRWLGSLGRDLCAWRCLILASELENRYKVIVATSFFSQVDEEVLLSGCWVVLQWTVRMTECFHRWLGCSFTAWIPNSPSSRTSLG